jgi:hypothetical protein
VSRDPNCSADAAGVPAESSNEMDNKSANKKVL